MTVRSDLDATIAAMREAGREVLCTTEELVQALADAIDAGPVAAAAEPIAEPVADPAVKTGKARATAPADAPQA